MIQTITHYKLRLNGWSKQLIARKIIQQVIKDLDRHNESDFLSAEQYVNSETFSAHLELSGYPSELRDTLKEVVLLSEPRRRVLCLEILALLKQIP